MISLIIIILTSILMCCLLANNMLIGDLDLKLKISGILVKVAFILLGSSLINMVYQIIKVIK